MWGFARWGLSHVALWWSWRTVIVGATILFLALVGAYLQDRKKAALLGDGWGGWAAHTAYWPRWVRLAGAGAVLWLVTIALWLAITWAHIHGAAFRPASGGGSSPSQLSCATLIASERMEF
jgi:hypothetical protein